MAWTRRCIARSDTESVPPTSLAINKTQRPSFIPPHLLPVLCYRQCTVDILCSGAEIVRTQGGLEVAGELGEGSQLEELAIGWRMVDVLALERPGEVVWDKDGVQAGGEGGVDVGLRAVADHPCRFCLAGVVFGQAAVGVMVLLG